ncbi:rhamnogalacturonan acetylesterase [Streptomyces flavidovirens]|uniref:Rhamnogalacturonan acetylesterase n=1 Tax=Streptomyces flavidovirens TaxID=67298 RepID=A0ABW6RIA3_9ACTN
MGHSNDNPASASASAPAPAPAPAPSGATSRRRFLVAAAALGGGIGLNLHLPSTAAADSRRTTAGTAATATVYIAGDSTAQTYRSGYHPQAGWGQTLPGFFTQNITIANHAIGGRSSRSFIEQGRLAAIHQAIRPGDYLCVQFGHNDATVSNPDRYTSPADYKEYLRNDYIRATRARGATPIVVTPVSRRSFNASTGEFNVSFPAYVNAARAVAAEERAPLVDLSELSRVFLTKLGVEASKNIFLWLSAGQYPNFPNGIQDNTHFQLKGATEMSRLVARAVAGLGLPLSGEVISTRHRPSR